LCEEHPNNCGEVLAGNVVVRLRNLQILVDGRREMAITAYWVSDSIDCCCVGFLLLDSPATRPVSTRVLIGRVAGLSSKSNFFWTWVYSPPQGICGSHAIRGYDHGFFHPGSVSVWHAWNSNPSHIGNRTRAQAFARSRLYHLSQHTCTDWPSGRTI
jgi:hypothetical protein